MTSVSYLRQMDIFNPDTFCQTCFVVGAGAVGSRLAGSLVRLGVRKLELFDADIIKEHNIPTGAFLPGQVGRPKTEAIAEQLSCFSGVEVLAHCEMVEKSIRFNGVVFLCVDTMEARRKIWKNCIKQNPLVSLMVETRIGPRQGLIYTVNPLDSKEIRRWENLSAYSDEYNEQLPCTLRSVITIVDVVVGLAVDQLIKWHSRQWFANSIVIGLQEEGVLFAERWT